MDKKKGGSSAASVPKGTGPRPHKVIVRMKEDGTFVYCDGKDALEQADLVKIVNKFDTIQWRFEPKPWRCMLVFPAGSPFDDEKLVSIPAEAWSGRMCVVNGPVREGSHWHFPFKVIAYERCHLRDLARCRVGDPEIQVDPPCRDPGSD